jgi:hypothetical protein
MIDVTSFSNTNNLEELEVKCPVLVEVEVF